MPDDQGLRKLPMQLRQHPPEGRLLLRRPGVRRLPMLIEAPLITDADGVTVVPITVRSYLLHGSSQFDTPIPSDDEMVPNALPGPPMPIFPCLMPLVNIGRRALPSRRDGRAMNNNQRNLPHNFSLFTIHYSLFPYYTQLMVANAVAIDVAIVATHLKTEITIFFFILHSSLFTIHYSLFP